MVRPPGGGRSRVKCPTVAWACLDGALQKVIESSLTPAFGVANAVSDELGQVVQKARKCSDAIQTENTTLVVDNTSRWWSTLAMIKSMVENKSAVTDLGSTECIMTDSDWDVLQSIKKTLNGFRTATEMLKGNANCTSPLVPFILFVIQNELSQTAEDSDSDTMTANTLAAFRDQLGNLPGSLHKRILLSHALDPRFKHLKVLSRDDDKEHLWNNILDEMVALHTTPPDEASSPPVRSSDASTAASILRGVAQKEEAKLGEDQKEDSIFDQYSDVLGNEQDKAEMGPGAWKAACKHELQLYRADSLVGMRTENGKEDPLEWWKVHHYAFPTLWKLAKIHLAIPATAMSHRRAFSIQDRDITLERYSIHQDLPEESDLLYENSWVLEE